MKKFKIVLMGILTLIIAMFCFVSCGVEGTYQLKSVTFAGKEAITVGVEGITAESFTVELKDDGTAVINSELSDLSTLKKAYTWAEKDGIIEIIQGDKTVMTATIEEDVMTLTAPLFATIILEKV